MASITSTGFKSEAYTSNLKEHLEKIVKDKIFCFLSNAKYTASIEVKTTTTFLKIYNATWQGIKRSLKLPKL